MWKRRSIYWVLMGKPEERGHLEDPGIGWRLSWICKKWGARAGLIWLRIWTGGGFL
jgi:hypothetical protein